MTAVRPCCKQTVNDLIGIDPDCFRPFTEAVTVPFQIFLVVWRHMFFHRRILSEASVQTLMGSDPAVIEEDFNGSVGYPHIDLIFDILIRHRVVHLVYCDVIVELYRGYAVFG